MPPKLRGSFSKSLARPGDTVVFYCSSCATWRRALSTRSSNVTPPRRDRLHASSTSFHRPVATSSSINAIKNVGSVPPRFKELYEALDQVRDAAAEQVSLSRLQLALRGLESETPLIRVAVLGLNDATAARKLVRLLLADPLNSREDWEDLLDGYHADTSRGLLIRYGEVSESIPNNLVPTISIPSPILKKRNMEILLTSLGADAQPTGARVTADTFLVPTVTIRTSHSGRHNFVRYPVHKSLVCGKGTDGLLAYSDLVSRSVLKRDAKSIRGAIELSVTDQDKGNDRIAFVDIEQAEIALAKFRESVQNASDYERGWNNSGVQPILDWLATSPHKGESLDPALEALIGSLLDSAEEGVLAKEAKQILEQAAASVSDEVRRDLDRAVSVWAERAHTELRDALEEGFASKRWRGLAWWKLFWRVDDVGMITSEILERRFLQQAEKEVIWTSGKFQQAGLLDEPQGQSSMPAAQPEGEEEKDARVAETIPSATSNSPWPTQISTSRARLLNSTVPSIQALAQNLVLFSVSTTTLTSALSALTYISFPVTTVYEACTFAAVGLIWSLRRQQKKWDSARTFWETEVREEGRTSLRETEAVLRTVVRNGGRQVQDVSEIHARETIERARKALEDAK